MFEDVTNKFNRNGFHGLYSLWLPSGHHATVEIRLPISNVLKIPQPLLPTRIIAQPAEGYTKFLPAHLKIFYPKRLKTSATVKVRKFQVKSIKYNTISGPCETFHARAETRP
jgi:hypothetical protein